MRKISFHLYEKKEEEELPIVQNSSLSLQLRVKYLT